MAVTFEDEALAELMLWVRENRKTAEKIYKLLQDIKRNGAANGEGKPERLKHIPAWSRRIDKANRLIYEIVADNIHVISCKGHYED